MSIKEKLLRFLRNKKGNALLLATAGAIAATFGVYFFTSITTLSEENKQRVTHLYNAYTMGQAIRAKIDGSDNNVTRLGEETKAGLESQIGELFHDGHFITLAEMAGEAIIVAADDPTATSRQDGDVPYDLTASGALITFVDSQGSAAGEDTIVSDVLLKINLAGSPDVTSNAPLYTPGDPFYYIVMTDTGDATGLTVTIPDFVSILDTTGGGPQAEGSVVLPQDNE